MFEIPKQSREESDARKKQGLAWKLERVGAAAASALWEHTDNPDAPMPLDSLFDANLSRFKRAEAFFAVCRDMIPDGLFDWLTNGRYRYDGNVLPIDPDRYHFDEKKIGTGAECNVYKLTSLDSDRPSFVIKIDNGLRRGADTLVERGKQIRSEYEEKKKWYRDLPDLIPDELQFISKSPRGGRNALFTIQEYLGSATEIHDLFQDYTPEQLAALAAEHSDLRQTLLTFAQITLERAITHDEMVDTLGRNNVAVIDRPGGARLMLIDTHVVQHPAHPAYPGQGERIAEHLRFLHKLVAELEALPEVSSVPVSETEK